MPQIKDMERTLYGTYHRNIIEYSTSRIKTPESIVEKLHRKNREVSLNKAIETLRDLAGKMCIRDSPITSLIPIEVIMHCMMRISQ